MVWRTAIISPCKLYRYELRRVWNRALPPYISGMLNPSTADHTIDDPTIMRNWYRAAAFGYGSLIVFNLGAGRAVKPLRWKQMADPIGPDNDRHIKRILLECKVRKGIVVVGWGTHGCFLDRDLWFIDLASSLKIELLCLGVTKDGYPKHPLYIPSSQRLIPYKP